MKTLTAVGLMALLPILAFAQAPSIVGPPPKPKPIEPIVPQAHGGPGRIGVVLVFSKDTGLPQIAALTRGGPASDFGFQVGDVILKIDKNYTSTLTEDEVKLALHGDPGSGVELTVQRGDDPHLIVRAVARRRLPANAEEMSDPALMDVKP